MTSRPRRAASLLAPVAFALGGAVRNGFGALLCQFLLNQENFQTRKSIELQLKDGVGLLLIQVKTQHDLSRCIGLAFARTNQSDQLVQSIEDDFEAL